METKNKEIEDIKKKYKEFITTEIDSLSSVLGVSKEASEHYKTFCISIYEKGLEIGFKDGYEESIFTLMTDKN